MLLRDSAGAALAAALSISLIISTTASISGCSGGSSSGSGGGGGGGAPGAPSDQNRAQRPAPLPNLSTQDVAARLTSAAAIATPAERDQLASSLEASAASPVVAQAAHDALAQFNTVAYGAKTSILLLSIDADPALLAPALSMALRAGPITARLTALAILARKPVLTAAADIPAALATLLAKTSELDLLQRHWLALALSAPLAQNAADNAASSMVVKALADSNIDLDTLAGSSTAASFSALVSAHQADLSPARLTAAQAWIKAHAPASKKERS